MLSSVVTRTKISHLSLWGSISAVLHSILQPLSQYRDIPVQTRQKLRVWHKPSHPLGVAAGGREISINGVSQNVSRFFNIVSLFKKFTFN